MCIFVPKLAPISRSIWFKEEKIRFRAFQRHKTLDPALKSPEGKALWSNYCIFADQKRKPSSQIVYSSSIDMKDEINIASDYKEALNDLKVTGEVKDIQNDAGLDSYDRVLFYAGSVVKAEIKNVTGINTAPLSPDDISLAKTKEIIPKCLISLLSWICGTSDYKEQKVLAIAQDIITVAPGGKKNVTKACWPGYIFTK